MGVHTTADETLDKVNEKLIEIIELLNVFDNPSSCWGANDYSFDYKEKIEKARTKIRKARLLLDR